MADSVQYALDRMADDLNDLLRRGIFSETEIRSIVAKRREFEYLLRRYEARKIDFMRYVEYELNLESLRAMRTKRIREGRKKKKGLSMSDTCCVRLIRWIFDRAVLKFAGDVDLWLHYIDFAAKQGQVKTLGRLCARALQLHPRNAGLWIKAASWEFFEVGNTSSARSLMQRGLRINPDARKLWLQYFRLEFYYVEKIMGRRELLGLEGDGDGGGASTERDGGDAVVGSTREGPRESEAMDIPQLEGEGEGNDAAERRPSFKGVRKAASAEREEAAQTAGSVMNDTVRRFYRGAVPLAVYRAAVKAVPDDVEFRAGFLRCCALDFPALGAEVAQAILTSIAEDFSENCDAWELRASYPLLVAEGSGEAGGEAGEGVGGEGEGKGVTSAPSHSGSAFGESVKIFERAVEEIGNRGPEIWMRYAMFLQRMVVASGEGRRRRKSDARSKAALRTETRELVQLMQEVLMKAVEMHVDKNHKNFVVAAAVGGGVEAAVSEAAAAERRKIATGKEADPEEMDKIRADAQEALGVGLADVSLMLDEPEAALAALRATANCLPTRPGPWLRLSSLERRAKTLRGEAMEDNLGKVAETASRDTSRQEEITPTAQSDGQMIIGCKKGTRRRKARDQSVDTLRRALKAVPATDLGYPTLWRELLGSLVAGGAGKKAITAAFRGAIEGCNPSGADPGDAQGEFLTGYIRWSAAVEGVEGARSALQWARRSFLLSGAGAAPAYLAAIELERMLGEEGGGGVAGGARTGAGRQAEGRSKRVRELFEDAVIKFGEDMPFIWEEYASFELQEGDVKRANAVRWRAQKSVGESPNKRKKRSGNAKYLEK